MTRTEQMNLRPPLLLGCLVPAGDGPGLSSFKLGVYDGRGGGAESPGRVAPQLHAGRCSGGLRSQLFENLARLHGGGSVLVLIA
jgi:hypothetical protein